MSFQQRTIGEICSELLAEAIRMGYSKQYVGGHMSKYIAICYHCTNHHYNRFQQIMTDFRLLSWIG